MPATRTVCISLLAAFLAALLIADADGIYRWMDAKGVTTYGNRPPPGARNLKLLSKDDDHISVIPIHKPIVEPRIRAPLAETVVSPPEQSISAVDKATVARSARSLNWRERCRAQHRVDCSDPSDATFDYVPAFAPDM
jgi:Domain of unknown function (DUF4124)